MPELSWWAKDGLATCDVLKDMFQRYPFPLRVLFTSGPGLHWHHPKMVRV
jgi:hypothetical protein